MELQKLVLAIMTVERDPPYVHQTIASLFASDPLVHDLPSVHLVIGSASMDYLASYRHHRAFAFHPLTEPEQETVKSWGVHRRFCHNYARCLSLPIPDGGGICVCEDDIVFRDRFLQRLMLTVREMEGEAGLRDYCLALFADADFERDATFYRGRYYCSYGSPFHGTQCMYYPRPAALPIRDYVWRLGVENAAKPGDLLLQDFCGDRMYACPRSLADHIGAVSTGLGGSRGSPTFARPHRPISPEEWGTRV
jgi:hypothetical protein